MDAVKNFFNGIFVPLLYRPLFNALIFLAYVIPGHSIGWAIIVLTVLIRLALLPSTIKTLEQQRRMREVQPKLDDLKSRHGADKAAYSKAMMELYAAERISPLGGCLPTLIQLPVLVVLYQVFIHGLSTDQFNLLYSFTPHLETINTHWFGLDLTKPEPWVLPLLAGAFQFLQGRQLMALSPASKDPNDTAAMMQKQMMFISPLITLFITRSVPAALGLYWVVFSLFSVIQQAYYLKNNPTGKVRAAMPGKSGVMVTVRHKNDKDEAHDTH